MSVSANPANGDKDGLGRPSAKLKTKEEIHNAFEHVKKHIAALNTPNDQLAWIHENLNDPESPLFLWPRQEVKEIVKNEPSKAKVRDFHLLTIMDLNDSELENVLQPMCFTCQTKVLLLLVMQVLERHSLHKY